MNKYLHTVASVGFLFTLNYDARNHELTKCLKIFVGFRGITEGDGEQFCTRNMSGNCIRV